MDAEEICVLSRAVVREGGASSNEDGAIDEEGEREEGEREEGDC
jgi:hypothetical protein